MNKTLKAVISCKKIDFLHQLIKPKAMKEAGLTPQAMFEELITEILLRDDFHAIQPNDFELSCLDVFCTEMNLRKENLDLSRVVTLFDAAYSNYRKHSIDHFRSLSKEDQVTLEPLFVADVQPISAIPVMLILKNRLKGFDINVQDASGHTMLMIFAANNGCYEAMKKTIDLGADIQVLSKKHGKAIHMINPASNRTEVTQKIDLLVSKGANLVESVSFKPLDELTDEVFSSYQDYAAKCLLDLRGKNKTQFVYGGTHITEYILNLCEVQKGVYDAIHRSKVRM